MKVGNSIVVIIALISGVFAFLQFKAIKRASNDFHDVKLRVDEIIGEHNSNSNE